MSGLLIFVSLFDLLLTLERNLHDANFGHSHYGSFFVKSIEFLKASDSLCSGKNISCFNRPGLYAEAWIHGHLNYAVKVGQNFVYVTDTSQY